MIFPRQFVIERQFFTPPNRPTSKEENPSVDNPDETIRITGMVDKPSLIATPHPINRPISINRADMNPSLRRSKSFRDDTARDELPAILGNLPARREGMRCETTAPVDSRLLDL
jgi:hypothetical protein